MSGIISTVHISCNFLLQVGKKNNFSNEQTRNEKRKCKCFVLWLNAGRFCVAILRPVDGVEGREATQKKMPLGPTIFLTEHSRKISRGSGVLPKGQHSWNISITKEARIDPEVVLDSSAECLFWGIFSCP